MSTDTNLTAPRDLSRIDPALRAAATGLSMFTNSISRHWRSSVLGWITSAQHVRLRSMWEASTSVSDVITGPTLNHYGCGPTGGEAASSQEIWAFEHAQCVELARSRLCHRLGRLSAGSGPVPHRHRRSRTRDGVGRQIPQRRETIALVGCGRRQRLATRIGYSNTGPTQSAPTRVHPRTCGLQPEYRLAGTAAVRWLRAARWHDPPS